MVSHLVGTGHDVSHVSALPWRIQGSQRIEYSAARSENFDAFIFTCGPVLRHHPETQALFKRFERIPRIAVGVSIMPPESNNFYNPFDRVLAREGMSEKYEDVAIVAPPRIYWVRQQLVPEG